MIIDWYELCHSLSHTLNSILLSLNQFENSFLFNCVRYLLPGIRATDVFKIRKVKLDLQVKVSVKVLLFDIYLSSEKYDVIDLNFFLAVSNQECFRAKCALRIYDP